MRRAVAVAILGVSFAASALARADSPEALKAFEEGRALRDQHEYAKAVAAFERSLAAEPSIGAFYNLGFAHEQLGRQREALDAYRRSAQLAKEKNDPREKEASDAATKLLESHNYVVLQLAEDVARTPELRIVVDSEVVPAKHHKGEVFRAAVSHEVVVSAPGHKEVRIQARNKQAVAVILGEPSGPAVAPPSPPPPPPQEGAGWGARKWTGAGLGAAGLVTTAVGVVFIAKWSSARSDLNGAIATCKHLAPDGSCRASAATTLDLVGKRDDMDSLSVKAWVTTSVGGALMLGGVLLFLTAPSEKSESQPATARFRVVPQVGLHGVHDSGATVVGTF